MPDGTNDEFKTLTLNLPIFANTMYPDFLDINNKLNSNRTNKGERKDKYEQESSSHKRRRSRS